MDPQQSPTSQPFAIQPVAAQISDIHNVLTDFAAAIQHGDLNRIMSFYSDDIVAFDMMPPLEFTAKDRYRSAWQDCFTSFFAFPVKFEYSQQKIFTQGDIAFSHALVHVVGAAKEDGKTLENWLRNTTCLKLVDGAWKIVHEHNSVPLDEKDMRGLMNLKPEGVVH